MKYFICFCAISFLLLQNTQSQTIDNIRSLYAAGKYAESLPLLEQVLKKTPKNPYYNQMYGSCLLKIGRLEAAKEYLLFAASKKVTEAFAALGELHYRLYEFEKSVDAYNQYINLLTKENKTKEAAEITPLMLRSERAARMLSRCEDIQIIDSIIMDKENFLNAYILNSECGALENKNGSIIHQNALKDKRCFSDKTEKGYYRLFSESSFQNNWGEKKELNLGANTMDNENYPFVLQDGLTVYYASTGENSIGGYDIFVTRHNMTNDTYLTPNQMGMPFNSIANDYMMVIDEINHVGYFATDRFQPENKVIIYTFIPNKEYLSIQTSNENERIDRAKIASIQNSWRPEENYVDLLVKIKSSVSGEQTKKAKDFFCVINDDVVYYTLNDFQNKSAKQSFLKSQELKKSITGLTEELDKLRMEYIRSNRSKSQNFISNVLSKEELLENLQRQYERAMVDARNQESQYLRIKN
jgi:tetratricopeptide (TPR) repeat protein